MFCYFLQKALFAFEIFCCFLFFPFLSTVSRFKRSDQERNFCQYVLQLKKRLVTSSRHFLISMILSVYRDWVQRKKIKSTFSWSVVYIACFGLFTNIKKGYETRFQFRLSAYIFPKNIPYFIPYQMIKFQYLVKVAERAKALQ